MHRIRDFMPHRNSENLGPYMSTTARCYESAPALVAAKKFSLSANDNGAIYTRDNAACFANSRPLEYWPHQIRQPCPALNRNPFSKSWIRHWGKGWRTVWYRSYLWCFGTIPLWIVTKSWEEKISTTRR